MRLPVARFESRREESDLARLQARSVGRALLKAWPELNIEYAFRASLGDKNLHDPLWKMPEKGVFTEDFTADLIEGRADLVVHSWKDLPIEARPDLEIVGSLPRADARDLLLFRKDRLPAFGVGAERERSIQILTSSPRRALNLSLFLKTALPFAVGSIEFASVRGNVPTRLRKLLESDEACGLVVAKAAIDRLLETENWGAAGDEFSSARALIRRALKSCRWMVLPLSTNPSAAAQGALAIEARKDADPVRALLAPVSCQETIRSAERERAVLASYGGGCHQKIGVSVLRREYGEILFLRGLTDAGVTLASLDLKRTAEVPRADSPEALYPRPAEKLKLFDREPLPESMWLQRIAAARGLWISRENSLPLSYLPSEQQFIWCAGVESWKKLALRGTWVEGCSDSLGELESPRLALLANAALGFPVHETLKWTKLSHDRSALNALRASSSAALDASEQPSDVISEVVPTYRLKPRAQIAGQEGDAFAGKTHFFWMSGTAFEEAIKLDPALLKKGHHSCGPGNTAQAIAARLGADPSGTPGRLAICLGPEAWREEALNGQSKRV